jgi:glycosyltransferase involved in cell wall biosynthesis
MNYKMKFLGMTLGDPFDQLSRSGVNFNIFSRLSSYSELVDVFNLDLNGLPKIWSAIKNISFDRREWGNKLHQNPWAFDFRTKKANRILNTISKEYDIIYQDGAMFMPGYSPNKPYISYHDSNVILATQGGPFSQGSHYKGKTLNKVIEQEKLVYDRASIIFTMSNWLKNSLIEDFSIPEKKIKIVYAGTNLPITDFKKTYDGKTILFVGRNFERKGGHTLLKAFKIVKKEIQDAQLIIIGPDLSIDRDGIKILNLITDKDVLAHYFKSASVFVLPSYFEPFGIAFAESFAYKTPCIGTNICAMPEIIEEGRGGFLIPPDDYKTLADRIIMILKNENLARRMGNYGLNKVRNTLNWDIVVNKMLKYCDKEL